MNFRNSNRSLYPRLREGLSQALFYILVIPALQKLRQELMAKYVYTVSTRLSQGEEPARETPQGSMDAPPQGDEKSVRQSIKGRRRGGSVQLHLSLDLSTHVSQLTD